MRSQANIKMTKKLYQGDKFKFKWEEFVAIHMKAHALYEQIGEIISEYMNVMSFISSIRVNTILEYTIKATRMNLLANSNFDNYVNSLTERITSKRGR